MGNDRGARRAAVAALRKTAAAQDGQFATAQARELGVSRSTLRTLRERGEVVAQRRGVWRFRAAAGTADETMTGYLACWPEGVLSHESAACWHGLELDEPPTAVHITLAHGHRRKPTGLVVHVTRDLPSGDVLTSGGLAVTSLARTLCDLAAGGGPGRTLQLLDQAVALGARPRWIHQRAEDLAPGRGGLDALRAATAPGAAPVFRSWLERTLDGLLAEAGLPAPTWNVAVGDAEGQIGIVDALWASEGVVVEAEGLRFHTSGEARRRDAERFNRLVAAGYTVRRFTWHDIVEEPGRVTASIGEALRTRAAVAAALARTERTPGRRPPGDA